MQLNLSLSQLFFDAFGYQTDAFDPKFKSVEGDLFNTIRTGRHGSPYWGRDLLGRQYYLPIEIVVGNDPIPGTNTTYAEALGVTDGNGKPSGRWNLPFPVISCDINKHIIDTELTERNGLVSELINISGYKIVVKGFIINKSNDFPEDDFDTLNRLFNLNKAVEINNVVTDILLSQNNGSKTVTLRNLRFPERVGVKHVRAYELDMLSDVPFNLIEIS